MNCYCSAILFFSIKCCKKLKYQFQAPVNFPMKISPPIKRASASLDFDNVVGNSNSTIDLFNLLSIHDDKQNDSTTPPSWTTFDCKITLLALHLLNHSPIFIASEYFFQDKLNDVNAYLAFAWIILCVRNCLKRQLCLQENACELCLFIYCWARFWNRCHKIMIAEVLAMFHRHGSVLIWCVLLISI